ncbi:hypothetical protein ENSA5_54300 [Enhygromyxa salina]|uniref:DUF6249 domain-containing protein n=1 Tax=Enhygromyxa salina TaxID=215803 RepID=A0A2S9XFB4_9BACT|nr:DUF6249 domain-containing protein [Enhygromyxa salina]PRP91554.1 hypothetical protein ENSA5_54300 [Enhygromyxa salina]
MPRPPTQLRSSLTSWGLAFGAGLVTWAVAGTAMAAELAPLVVDAGIGGQGCSGMLGYVLELDSMLFEAQTPACSGFRAFDIAFLAVVALIVISAIRFRHATTRRRLELARRMVEKGIEPPAELVGANHGSDLRRGLVLVSTGVGLMLASLLGGGAGLSPAGLIPGFIGIGYLVSHRFAVTTPAKPSAKPRGDA